MDIMIIINMILHKMVSITTLILTLISVYSTFCLPTKPLNERTTQLAWQAWLLVDDQNQTKQAGQDGILRRRITPKSVFIAPTFSPEFLPDCAEGYTSDSMGRCIKIIKLDEDMHLDFLLQKLNEKFGGSGVSINEDLETRDTTTSGPLQLTIPLEQENNNNNMGTEQTDVAIVVAPSSGDFPQVMEEGSTINKDMGNTINVKTIAHILGIKQEDLETTTLTDTSIPTTNSPTYNTDTTTTTTETGSPESTTTFEIPTTEDNRAIFFMIPTTTTTELTEQTETIFPSTVVTTEETPQYPITTEANEQFTTLTQLESVVPTTTVEYHSSSKNLVRFPEETSASSSIHPEKRTANFRFPDDEHAFPQEQHEQLIFSRDISDDVRTVSFDNNNNNNKMLNDYPVNYRHSHHHDRLETATIDSIHQGSNRHIFSNKRNNLYVIPPVRWGDSSQQKPLVLRFSRKQDSINTQQFDNNPQYFRHIPSGDLSYVFGFKHKPNSRIF